MKFLNSDGLRTILNKIKDKFATKEELQELAKKSSGKLVPSGNDGGSVDLSDYVKKEELQEQLKNVKASNVRLVDNYPDKPEEDVLYFLTPRPYHENGKEGFLKKTEAYRAFTWAHSEPELYSLKFFDNADIDTIVYKLLNNPDGNANMKRIIEHIADSRINNNNNIEIEKMKNLINNSSITLFKTLTQAQYDALEPKEKRDSKIIYFISEG